MNDILSAPDLAVDHALAQLSESFRFILDITPIDAQDVKLAFLEDEKVEPEFGYRDLEIDPRVVRQMLDDIDIDLGAVQDATLGHLLRAKHREMEIQLDMLQARESDDFLQLSIELYGCVSPQLRDLAEALLAAVTESEPAGDPMDADEFLGLAETEIRHYRQIDPEIEMHAEIHTDVNGVMVSGDTLLVGVESRVQRRRAQALLHHEVGTHLLTQVNGAHQPMKVLGAGLAGYDETQEGLAVLAEIGCGGLTAFRLRQLAGRVVTVHRLVAGASFAESYEALVDSGFPRGSAFNTVMRVYRSGGMTKDAIYLRGLVALLHHLRNGGDLDLLWLGKFSLEDFALVGDLKERGVLNPPRLLPRYLDDPDAAAKLEHAASIDDLSMLLEGDT
ncbi:MAG: flavohemoglobin expression-modulating QEGLA motif protein [Aeromicrobium sp.]